MDGKAAQTAESDAQLHHGLSIESRDERTGEEGAGQLREAHDREVEEDVLPELADIDGEAVVDDVSDAPEKDHDYGLDLLLWGSWDPRKGERASLQKDNLISTDSVQFFRKSEILIFQRIFDFFWWLTGG